MFEVRGASNLPILLQIGLAGLVSPGSVTLCFEVYSGRLPLSNRKEAEARTAERYAFWKFSATSMLNLSGIILSISGYGFSLVS